ncbi:thiamine pyrophosphate-binding protein [Bacillus sp. Marseille-P3661]|uniref:thiamine pyrophosphate-binding protein n=1 Tax=Bacillus sp. Marseille-P3661 TaxID=1936234 RepID=UPI000C84422A|nr:thiamine pyrophosphate-dependent enzyme [Bacillus sp. Marseille-P3661]
MALDNGKKYGSDIMAELISNLNIPFIALNPGASYRGLHDSLINHPDKNMPEIITCTHEEISVDIAHGYAKATGRPMAAAIHNVVGLQHASMAIFNAWCARVPMLLYGGTGPMNVEERRPWIDWIHTALVQGNLIRDFVKWDDQPATLNSLEDSIYRAYRLAVTEPAGPTYVCFDSGLQEQVLPDNHKPVEPFDESRYVPDSPGANPSSLEQLAEALITAEWPVILVDHTGRSDESFRLLSELSEEWAIPVLDLNGYFNMSTTHPMNLTGDNHNVLEKADVILALDVRDIFGTVSKIDRVTRKTESVLRDDVRVFSMGLQDYSVRSWAADYQKLFPTEKTILADTKTALPLLKKIIAEKNQTVNNGTITIEDRFGQVKEWHDRLRAEWLNTAEEQKQKSPITASAFALELWNAIKDEDFMVANGGLSGWVNRIFDIKEPRQSLGVSWAGGGIGCGIGMTIGACLAHRGTDKLIVDIQSDGDLLFTSGGLWTLAHHELPALIVMFNNRSYYNSEEHQINIARHRNRDVSRTVIGTRIENPNVNFAKMAETFGIHGIGPIERIEDLGPTIREAIEIIKRDKVPVLIDVVTQAK